MFIANIKFSEVQVNCFLFEIKNGQKLPVQKGYFELLRGESPMRVNEGVMESIRNGAETLHENDFKPTKPTSQTPVSNESKRAQTNRENNLASAHTIRLKNNEIVGDSGRENCYEDCESNDVIYEWEKNGQKSSDKNNDKLDNDAKTSCDKNDDDKNTSDNNKTETDNDDNKSRDKNKENKHSNNKPDTTKNKDKSIEEVVKKNTITTNTNNTTNDGSNDNSKHSRNKKTGSPSTNDYNTKSNKITTPAANNNENKTSKTNMTAPNQHALNSTFQENNNVTQASAILLLNNKSKSIKKIHQPQQPQEKSPQQKQQPPQKPVPQPPPSPQKQRRQPTQSEENRGSTYDNCQPDPLNETYNNKNGDSNDDNKREKLKNIPLENGFVGFRMSGNNRIGQLNGASNSNSNSDIEPELLRDPHSNSVTSSKTPPKKSLSPTPQNTETELQSETVAQENYIIESQPTSEIHELKTETLVNYKNNCFCC